ncbi:hypothetical protein XENOCAPTIV_022896, partial [Xenoophorus captivus]
DHRLVQIPVLMPLVYQNGKLGGHSPLETLNQPIALGMKRGGPCPRDAKPPADSTEHLHLKIPTLITVQLFRSTKPAEHLACQSLSCGDSALAGDGICLWPLGKIVHGNQDVARTSMPTCSIGAPTWYCCRGHVSAGLADFLLCRYHNSEHGALHLDCNQANGILTRGAAVSQRPQNGPPLPSHGPSEAPWSTAVGAPPAGECCNVLPELVTANKGHHRDRKCRTTGITEPLSLGPLMPLSPHWAAGQPPPTT